MKQLTIRISEGDDSTLRNLQDVMGFGSISDVTREAIRRGMREMKKEYGLIERRSRKSKAEE